MIRTAAFAAVASFLLAAPALAGENDDSPALRACLEKAHAHRPIAHCYAQEIDRLKTSIDAAVKAAEAAAPTAAARKRIALDQDSWEKATDSKCEAAASSNKGTLGSMRGQSCFLEAYRARDGALHLRRRR